MDCIKVADLNIEHYKAFDVCRRVYSPDGIAPTVTAGGALRRLKLSFQREERMQIRTNNTQGWMHGGAYDGVVLNFLGKARGTVRYAQAPTIQCDGGGSSGVITMQEKIRKLTERECLRLMGFNDAEIDKLRSAKDEKGKPMFSRTALYQFAGNSVVVDCYQHIVEEILKDIENPNRGTLDRWFQ